MIRLLVLAGAGVAGFNLMGLIYFARHGMIAPALLCAVGCAAYTYSLPYLRDLLERS